MAEFKIGDLVKIRSPWAGDKAGKDFPIIAIDGNRYYLQLDLSRLYVVTVEMIEKA